MLIAGRNALNMLFPSLVGAFLARNVYPRNVNDVFSQSPSRRFLSLQYTILVLSGCSRSPTSAIRSSSAASTCSGLPLGRAMHHGVISVALELHSRELALQPRIERIVHEQVSEHG